MKERRWRIDCLMVRFETFSKDCHSEARIWRARNLLFHCRQQADSSPTRLARNDKSKVCLLWRKSKQQNLLDALSLYDGDVPVNRQVREGLNLVAGSRPANFQAINLRTIPDAQDFARIV